MKPVQRFSWAGALPASKPSIPKALGHEVLVEVKATGICHTDYYTLLRGGPRPVPAILGQVKVLAWWWMWAPM